MKKLLAFLGAAALVVAIVLVIAKPVTAHAQAGGSIAAFCQELGVPQGECVSAIATLGPSFVCGTDVHGGERWVSLGFKNKGECVSYVQQVVRNYMKNGTW
jgi:hypothetical protein